MARKFAENVPSDLAHKLRTYMAQCGYSQGTIEMRIGNLGYLFEVIEDIRNMLKTPSTEQAQIHARTIKDSLPSGGVRSADVQAFKLTWETIHGQELFKKRVQRR